MKKRSAASVLNVLVCVLLIAACSPSAPGGESGTVGKPAQRTGDASVRQDAPYYWTELDVAAHMMKMAGAGKDDMVYDLGCGDGRIVIAGAELFGARGVGLEIDPKLVAESKENAERAGVADRVQFFLQDIFTADISAATVVALYLGAEVNLRLRPKLLRELKPGTRIVSNDFDMGEWKADQTAVVGRNKLHYWVVPANVSGTWKTAMPGEERTLLLKQRFQQVKGSIRIAGQALALEGVSLAGNQLRFSVKRALEGIPQVSEFEGRVTGDVMEGKFRGEGGQVSAAWKAWREAGSTLPLDGP